jgi:26S proteasome regulatory subunit N6
MALLKESNEFFALIPKAKTAKIVRTIIDIVTKVPDSVELQVELCKEVREGGREGGFGHA